MSSITVPAYVPHASTDCQHLRDALQGFSLGVIVAEERKIIEILAHRDADTRREICQMYNLLYKEDLTHRLNIELTKKLQKAMLWWVLDPAERDARLAREALQCWNAKYQIIIEIACCRNSDELINIRRAYHARYKKSLEEDIAWETTGSVQKLLLGLVTAYRYGGNEVDNNIARKEAEQLFETCKNKPGKNSCIIDDDTFIRILSTRSFSHLNETIEVYKQAYGHDINQALKGVEAGEFEAALRMTIKCINRPARYFSKVLHVGLREEEVDDETVTRVMTSRAEINMQHIKTEYARKYHNSLELQVKARTIGNYKIFILKLMGLNVNDRN